jgi:hypothetical protein
MIIYIATTEAQTKKHSTSCNTYEEDTIELLLILTKEKRKTINKFPKETLYCTSTLSIDK